MMFVWLPAGGLWPEIVPGPTWLLEAMTWEASAVPPPKTRKKLSARERRRWNVDAYGSWLFLPRIDRSGQPNPSSRTVEAISSAAL